jgi:hypothetical protein
MRMRRWSSGVVAVGLAFMSSYAQAADKPALRGYPDPVPEDVSYEAVVGSQPFPLMKYPVPIIGAKVHPEEVHVTPSGQLIFPRYEHFRGPCVAVLIGSRPAGERGAGEIPVALPPVEGVTSKLVDGYMPGI